MSEEEIRFYREAMARLVNNAVECTNYVALGTVMKNELIDNHPTVKNAGGLLCRAALDLNNQIRSLYKPDMLPTAQ